MPDGWYHAVLNLADTVAVSYQSRDMQPEAQHAACFRILRRIIKMQAIKKNIYIYTYKSFGWYKRIILRVMYTYIYIYVDRLFQSDSF